MNSKTQRNIAIVAIVVTAVAIGWMLTHRRVRKIEMPGPPVGAPALLELSVQHDGQKRPSKAGDTLSVGDALDFHIEVKDMCFVYVFTVQQDAAKLDWGPRPDEPPWQSGVYAPDFYSGKNGLHFANAGDAALYVVASPLPIADAAKWDLAALQNVAEKCAKCSATSAKFRVVEQQ